MQSGGQFIRSRRPATSSSFDVEATIEKFPATNATLAFRKYLG